ncbi:MAG: phosphoribosylanthranilate isomerase [Kofleriaceae bacterium]
MTLVKICGVTLPDDAASVASAGVDFIGLNFWPRSKRYLAPERAPMIAGIVRSTGPAKLVGVFVDAEPDEILAIAGRVELDIIQLHGDEDPDTCRRIVEVLYRPVWKAIAVRDARDLLALDRYPVDAILLDAPVPGRGGAGTTFDHALAREARTRFPQLKIVLAGGLAPATVAAAVAQVQPWAVDVASGVEVAPGIKDRDKVAAFLAAARGTSGGAG